MKEPGLRDIVYVNGRYVPRDEALVSVEDRAYQFGDGVYEVVRFHGRRNVRLRAHLERLERSCQALRIQGAPSVDEWTAVVDQLMDECRLSDEDDHVWSLYQQVSRGVCARNHVFPKTPCQPSSVAYFRPAPQYSHTQREQGVALSSQLDERWERCNIKAVCLLPVVMAKQAAIESGAFEALLVRNGIVTEGGATNAYCVRDGAVWTHPEGNHILSGITRGLILEAAERAGVSLVEKPVTLDQFKAAEEAFISSTTMDIMPATVLDGKPVGDGKVGPITKSLMTAINELIAQEIGTTVISAR
jgi:D-alanine transaminase